MSDTSIQTRPTSAPSTPSPAPPGKGKEGGAKGHILPLAYKALKALASLRLTVFLFVLSMILVFCGTLAMMDQGLFTVLSRYFRSFFAWIPLQTFVRFGQVFFGLSPDTQIAGSIPFPGGWSIGAALLVNLLAAHAVRFRMTWKRAGILILHSGLVLLMVGELVTGLFSVESSMTISVGGSSNYIENFDHLELAFVWPADAKNDNVVVVPDHLIHQGSVIHDDRLPVDIDVVRYLPNTTLSKEAPAGANLATRGVGLERDVIEQPPGRGVDADQKRDMPSAYVALKDKKSGEALGTYLVSPWLYPQDAEIGGRTYQLSFRQKRSYRPFTFHLKELRHETYRGTNMAKQYASLVRLTDPSHNEDRDVLIHMNHPFYYEGETFYQVQVQNINGVDTTVLQVIHNPGWALPYIACTMVVLGMIVHFILHLMSFFHRMVT
jgi:hypothetical protein